MKSLLLFLACTSFATAISAQHHLAAGNERGRSAHVSVSAQPDTSSASILKNWFKPLEHPDKNFLKKQQATPAAAPQITNVQHTILHYNKSTYCGHPRMVNFNYFPPNEIIVGHFHAPSDYKVYDDVRHISYQSRSVCLLQRSTDMGKTWPKENDVVLFDNTIPKEKKIALGNQRNALPENYNMFSPESAFFFTNTIQYPLDSTFNTSLIAFRSANRGRTWKEQPYAVKPPAIDEQTVLSKQNTPVIRMPDGKTLLGAFWIGHSINNERRREKATDGAAIFSSTDQGVTWNFLSRPIRDKSGDGIFIYETLLLLPDGNLHLYSVHLSNNGVAVEGMKNAITLSISRDGGKTFSDPVPITGKGAGAWGVVDDSNVSYKITYRAPWPILLKDGRILLVFTRRKMPAGIGGIISSDGGKTWSEEFIIRDGAKWWDIGYPVGTQLADGRIFISYYYNTQDGNEQGGTRFIAGSFFEVGK